MDEMIDEIMLEDLRERYRHSGMFGVLTLYTGIVNAALRRHEWGRAKEAVRTYDRFMEDRTIKQINGGDRL